mgnify:CR=1 FL=1
MYYGEHQTVLDDKGRVTAPVRFRDIMRVLGHDMWYMTRGFDHAIFLFHRKEWERICSHARRYSTMNAKALDFRRLLFGSVAEVRPDRQGRILVPTHLREHAGLEREAVLIGVDDHLELWSKEGWASFQKSKDDEFKEMATQLFAGDEQSCGNGETENVADRED